MDGDHADCFFQDLFQVRFLMLETISVVFGNHENSRVVCTGTTLDVSTFLGT